MAESLQVFADGLRFEDERIVVRGQANRDLLVESIEVDGRPSAMTGTTRTCTSRPIRS